jgi:hypothetical protein
VVPYTRMSSASFCLGGSYRLSAISAFTGSTIQYYCNSRKPEAGRESQAPGCTPTFCMGSLCNIYIIPMILIISDMHPCCDSFPRHFNAYLTRVSYIPVMLATEWMGTHILTVKRPLGNPSCTLSCNRFKPASWKLFFQCKSDLERRS